MCFCIFMSNKKRVIEQDQKRVIEKDKSRTKTQPRCWSCFCKTFRCRSASPNAWSASLKCMVSITAIAKPPCLSVTQVARTCVDDQSLKLNICSRKNPLQESPIFIRFALISAHQIARFAPMRRYAHQICAYALISSPICFLLCSMHDLHPHLNDLPTPRGTHGGIM